MLINNLKIYSDERGDLLPIEFKSIPFEIKRIFFINNVQQFTERGGHAHHKTIQYLICVEGQIEVILHDGVNEKRHLLNKGDGVLVNNLIWDSQKFMTNDSNLLVLCSTEYSQEDYILNFEIFENLIKNNKK